MGGAMLRTAQTVSRVKLSALEMPFPYSPAKARIGQVVDRLCTL